MAFQAYVRIATLASVILGRVLIEIIAMNFSKLFAYIKAFMSPSTTQTVKLSGKIKIFESVLKNAEILGINLHQANQNHLLNMKFWFILVQFGVVLVSYLCFVTYEANTFEEYTSSIYSILTLLTTALHFLMQQWKMGSLFKFIINFENFINKSGC